MFAVAAVDEVDSMIVAPGLAVDTDVSVGGLVTGRVQLTMMGDTVVVAVVVRTTDALVGMLPSEAGASVVSVVVVVGTDALTDILSSVAGTSVVSAEIVVGTPDALTDVLSSETGTIVASAGIVVGTTDALTGVLLSEAGISVVVGRVDKFADVSSSGAGEIDILAGGVVRDVLVPGSVGQHVLSAAFIMFEQTLLDFSVFNASITSPPQVVPCFSEITTLSSTESPAGQTGHGEAQHTASAAFVLEQIFSSAS